MSFTVGVETSVLVLNGCLCIIEFEGTFDISTTKIAVGSHSKTSLKHGLMVVYVRISASHSV